MRKIIILFVFVFIARSIEAHNIDYSTIILKKWLLNNEQKVLEGSLYMYKNGEVYIEDAQNKIVHYPLSAFSFQDREYVAKRYEKIALINYKASSPEDTEISLKDLIDFKVILLLFLLTFLGIYIFRFANKEKLIFLRPIFFVATIFFLFGFVNNKIRKPGSTITNPLFIDSAFTYFKPKIHTSWDNTYFFVESKGIPDHEMMTGIISWQQQLPIPQCYTIANNNNMWSIPLNPVIASTPVPVNTQHFLRGAIALAVNGIPIFSPFTNTGVDAFVDGQLDNWGGHSGRADDYHYHIAPLHLYSQVAETLSIAFALDGFGVYGSKEPDGSLMTTLDGNHGHYWNGVYHYHGTTSKPYMIGNMVGVVTEDNTMQIIPQATAKPVRPSLTPLSGAVITACVANSGKNGYNMTYTRNTQTYHVNYQWTDTTNSRSKYSFSFLSPTSSSDSIYLGFSQSECKVPDTSGIIVSGVSKSMLRLPDTGEKIKYSSSLGEDADYSINPPYFIDHNDGTVTDTVTGLMWQKKDGGEMTWENALKYADTLSLAGYTDWRLPNAHEGFSIMNEQFANPALDTLVFTKTLADYWWTSTTQFGDSTKIWCTNAGGGIGNKPKTETISAGGKLKYHPRVVRDVKQPGMVATHFTNNYNGTITDNLTNLVWQKVPFADTLSWENALKYADTLTLGGITDWRLPNIKELQSINNEKLTKPSIDTGFLKLGNNRKYWSSTTLPNHTTQAWYLNTTYGVTTYDLKTARDYVFCVSGNGAKALATGIEFTAKNLGNKSLLNWNFSTSQNVDYFIVQRTDNMLQWTDLDNISNNSILKNTYSYIDPLPNAGINYYRIKVVYLDGKITYSNIKKVLFETSGQGFKLFPNPAKDEVFIQLNSNIKETDVKQIQVFNMVGSSVFLTTHYINLLNTNNLERGIYIVKILLNNNSSMIQKLLLIQ